MIVVVFQSILFIIRDKILDRDGARAGDTHMESWDGGEKSPSTRSRSSIIKSIKSIARAARPSSKQVRFFLLFALLRSLANRPQPAWRFCAASRSLRPRGLYIDTCDKLVLWLDNFRPFCPISRYTGGMKIVRARQRQSVRRAPHMLPLLEFIYTNSINRTGIFYIPKLFLPQK